MFTPLCIVRCIVLLHCTVYSTQAHLSSTELEMHTEGLWKDPEGFTKGSTYTAVEVY